jgi:hypothetical protein
MEKRLISEVQPGWRMESPLALYTYRGELTTPGNDSLEKRKTL